MSFLKSNVFGSFVNGLVVDLASPVNLTYAWNFGSLLGVTLVSQILSGVFLGMHYAGHVELAFYSVEHIMSDVQVGWFISYLHSNGASVFFILVYLHMGSGMYYGSYTSPSVMLWWLGVMIFLLMMGIAFLGYVLPWGQMSFWGATVITNMLSAIPFWGVDLVQWVWGGFSVDNATLNSFFSFHYLLPFVLLGLVLMHVIVLHETGSNNPVGLSSDKDSVVFHFYFSMKDLVGFVVWMGGMAYLVFYVPNMLGHSDNYIEADPLVTPEHIQPEWYFLPYYAILSAVPNKMLGVLAMVGAIMIMGLIPYLHVAFVSSGGFSSLSKSMSWFSLWNFVLLGWIGSSPAEYPFSLMAQVCTCWYFFYYLVGLSWIGFVENLGYVGSSGLN